MNDDPLLQYIFALLVPIGIIGFIVHQRSYALLYKKLRERELIGAEYKPDWSTFIGSGGCMGLIKKLKREVGLMQLHADEIYLVKRATYAYHIGVPALFLAVCAMFWFFYRDAA